jgi:hypothetical protein
MCSLHESGDCWTCRNCGPSRECCVICTADGVDVWVDQHKTEDMGEDCCLMPQPYRARVPRCPGYLFIYSSEE